MQKWLKLEFPARGVWPKKQGNTFHQPGDQNLVGSPESKENKLKVNENIKLRVFIDNSIIEVFANDRQALCRRIYPEKKGNGLNLFSIGGDINVKSLKSWEIMPSNPY